jgi:hypothetical protein
MHISLQNSILEDEITSALTGTLCQLLSCAEEFLIEYLFCKYSAI